MTAHTPGRIPCCYDLDGGYLCTATQGHTPLHEAYRRPGATIQDQGSAGQTVDMGGKGGHEATTTPAEPHLPADPDTPCGSRGPRIGDGRPLCRQPSGHAGQCRGFDGSGYESVQWRDRVVAS